MIPTQIEAMIRWAIEPAAMIYCCLTFKDGDSIRLISGRIEVNGKDVGGIDVLCWAQSTPHLLKKMVSDALNLCAISIYTPSVAFVYVKMH